MNWLNNLSIRRKLTVITIAALGIPLVLACAAFVAYDQASVRSLLAEVWSARVRIIARLSVSALQSHDLETAHATLAIVGADPDLRWAGIYDARGARFASYARVGVTTPAQIATGNGVGAGDRFGWASVVLQEPVMADGAPIGTLVTEWDLSGVAQRLARYLLVVFLVLMTSILLGHLIASRLQRVLTGPVLHLVSVARVVTEQKDFSARATTVGKDELGLLTVTFNEMLNQIQERDAAIETATAALKDNEQRLKAILDSTVAIIYAKGADGRYILVNRRYEELFRRKAEDVVGKTDFDFFPKETAEAYRVNDQRVIETRQPIQVEEVVELEDGPHTYISAKVPLFDPQGNAYAMCAISTDISETKQLEAARWRAKELEEQNRQAQEANRLKSEFLANMSHELRTPLNAIIGFAALIHKEKAGPLQPRQKEFLGDILTSARHLLQLINDVLDLAKVESGKLEFYPQPVAMEVLVKEVCDILRTIAAEKHIRIKIEIEPALGAVYLDPAKLKQVLYNYLSNALKFTPQGGHVTIRVRSEGLEHFRVEVEDTGIGISEQDIARLFSEFTQLDAGDGKQYGGTGLGLALCKRLITAQGGSVGVRSTKGLGSVFSVVLPKKSLEATPVVPDPVRTPRSGAPTVLVVEDESREREFLTRIISEAGYNVDTAVTGRDAAERLRSRAYDAVTLDILLPDMVGWEVLRELRRTSGLNRDVPVIVVTVVAEKVTGECAVHDFLTKPVEPSLLLMALKRAGISRDGNRPILVVDDDPAAVKLMQTALAELGYRSSAAIDGEAAMKTAAADPPAAVVLDLNMPGMNGFEFLALFRQTPYGQRVPVVVWTVADITTEMRERLANAAQGIVHKDEEGVARLLEELRRYVPLEKAVKSDGG